MASVRFSSTTKVCPFCVSSVFAVLISVCVAAALVVDQDDEISKTLKHIGVNYTHRNESLIAENVVEKERIKVLLAVSISFHLFRPSTHGCLHRRSAKQVESPRQTMTVARRSRPHHNGRHAASIINLRQDPQRSTLPRVLYHRPIHHSFAD